MQTLKKIPDYHKYRIVKDERLLGETRGEMYEKDVEIRVSPAMYELLKSDFEAMSKVLRVRVLPAKKTETR